MNHLSAIALCLGMVTATAAAPQRSKSPGLHPPTRAATQKTIKEAFDIATPEGINELEQIDVGDGDKQWISIRGRNRANPVLLLIHGGPGFPMMPFRWAYQSPWEDFFTVVNWDQRGVGKNQAGFDFKRKASTLTMDRVVDDGIAVIDHVRKKLGKSKVVVLGFSWGSMVGVHLVKKRPDLVSAYVGVGQAASPSDEGILYTETIKGLESIGDSARAAQLKAMGPYPRADGSTPMEVGFKVRKYALQFDGLWYGQADNHLLEKMPYYSPDYSDDDIVHFPEGERSLIGTGLLKALETDDLRALGPDFKVPVIFLIGRYDLFTPWAASKKWFEEINAPFKKFVTFQRSSHFVMIEEPGRFLLELVNDVLPLTEGSPAYVDAPRAYRGKPGGP
jgi:pimeloyl-ACP methyl ester carboxylesterase